MRHVNLTDVFEHLRRTIVHEEGYHETDIIRHCYQYVFWMYARGNE